jgi:hypothetical protein
MGTINATINQGKDWMSVDITAVKKQSEFVH